MTMAKGSKPTKLYVVDDDPFFIELMTDLLEGAGYFVSSHHAAAYALSEIRGEKPDCVLIDLQMSEMDGIELCGELRKIPSLKNTKIIMVSAHTEDVWKNSARDLGADAYIEKPLDADEFLETVGRVVSSRA